MTQIIAGHGEIVNTEETSQMPANEFDYDCIPETTDDVTNTTAPLVDTSATPTGHDDDLSSSSYSRSTNFVHNREG